MNKTYFLFCLLTLCASIGISTLFGPLSSLIGPSSFASSSSEEDGNKVPIQQSIDTSLYSRQLFVYGKSAQMKLLEGKVVLVAEDELLSFEVAKNLALTGVGKIALYSMEGSNFSEKLRISGDDGSLSEYVGALNPYVKVQNISFSTSLAYASLPNDLNSAVIVICSNNFTTINQWNQFARRNNVRTVAIYQKGKVGFVFDDFLGDFQVLDVEGEVFKEVLLSNSVKTLSDDCLEIHSIDEEVLGYGIGDHITIHPASTSITSSTNISNGLSMEFIVKEVINMQTCIIQPILPHEGDVPSIITLITSNNATVQKLKLQRTVHHAPFELQLLHPSFTPGNGCLSPRQDRVTNLILLSLLKVDFIISQSDVSQADYERQLNASLQMELQLLTNNSDIFTPSKSKTGKMSVNLVYSLFTSFLLSCSRNDAKRREFKQCPALVSVLGAIGAQEAIKGLTQLYLPVDQFMMIEGLDTVHPLPLAAASSSVAKNDKTFAKDDETVEQTETGSTLHKQQQLQSIEQELAGLKIFVVGAGAIGCELLKTFALLGVGTGSNTRYSSSSAAKSSSLWSQHGLDAGGIIVTDMDHIERSNLNRQLLFRPKHIGLAKSSIAAHQVKKINQNVNILALTTRVGRTEEIKGKTEETSGKSKGTKEGKQILFDEAFWQEIDIVVTALDNVDARLFIDEQCVKYKLWLIDSGTLGTKGNTQVITPYLTESYGSSADPPEEKLPLCTVKSFPYQPEHCVAWAKELFATAFGTDISNLEQYLLATKTQERGFKSGKLTTKSGEASSQSVANNDLTKEDRQRLQDNIASLDQPITWAKNLFTKLFHTDVLELIQKHPEGSVDEDDPSTPFWSGSRRFPSAIVYDEDDDLHIEFIASAVYVKLRALNQLPVDCTLEAIKDKIKNNEDIFLNKQEFGSEKIQLQQQTFEKDELSLGHVHFVTSAANLRSRVYHLKEVDLFTAQGLAGKIIPALATTTALVSGLVSMEVIKVASERILLRSGQNNGFYQDNNAKNQTLTDESSENNDQTRKVSPSIGRRILNQILRKKQPENPHQALKHRLSHTHPMQRLLLDEERLLKRFRNSFVNLASPLLSFAQPVSADTLSLHSQTKQKFNSWHEINLDLSSTDDITVEELLHMLKEEYAVEVTAIMAEVSMLYASFLPDAEEIRGKSVTQLLRPLLPPTSLSVGDDEDYEADEENVENEDETVEENVPMTYHRTQVVRFELSCHKASPLTNDDTGEETEPEEVRLPPLVIRIQQPPSAESIVVVDEHTADDGDSDDDDNSDDDNSLFRRGWRIIKENAKLIFEK